MSIKVWQGVLYILPYNNMKNNEELLKYAVDNGMINLSYVQEQIEMKEKEKLLGKHPYAISQGKDGKWRTYFPDKDKGRRMIKRNTKAEIEKEIVLYWKQETKDPTVKKLFSEWIERKVEYNDICRGTYDRYKQDFMKFFEDDSNLCEEKVRKINPNDIIEFLRKAIVKYSLTAKSYSNLRTIVYGIFKYAKEKGYISWSISQTINDMDLPKKAFRKVIKEDDEEVFNDEEIGKLINHLSSSPDMLNLGIILMFCTGCRVGELVAIKWCDVDGNSIKIRRTEITYRENDVIKFEIRDYPKTEAGIRTVFVPREFISIIGRLRLLSENNEYIFSQNGKKIMASQIRKRLYLSCKQLGIRKKSPHKLRKTYVSILLDNGVDKRLVQDVAGHAQISTSERNYHRNRKSDQKKQEILSNLPEFKDAKLMF